MPPGVTDPLKPRPAMGSGDEPPTLEGMFREAYLEHTPEAVEAETSPAIEALDREQRQRRVLMLKGAIAVPLAVLVAIGGALLLHTLADFADFRGLPAALAAFDAAPPATLRADAVRLGRPLLDHRYAFEDPALPAARQRVGEALRAGSAVGGDARVLLGKVLLDHDGLRQSGRGTVEHRLALMQETVQRASPRCQAAVVRGLAQSPEYIGQTTSAQGGTQHLQ